MIQQTFFKSEKIADLSIPARLILLGLMIEADDYGYVKLNPKVVKGSVLPYDDLTVEQVTDIVQEWTTSGFVTAYEVEGETYGKIEGWDDKNSQTFQTVNRPSARRNPLPLNDDSVSAHAEVSDDSVSAHGPTGNRNPNQNRKQGTSTKTGNRNRKQEKGKKSEKKTVTRRKRKNTEFGDAIRQRVKETLPSNEAH